MAKIKLEFDAKPFTGQIVTFVAPCACEEVTDGLVINGNTYTIVDAMGSAIKAGAWCSGALVSVSLDVTNRRAYVQNNAVTPASIGAVSKSGDTMTGNLVVSKATPAIDLVNSGNRHATMKLYDTSGYFSIEATEKDWVTDKVSLMLLNPKNLALKNAVRIAVNGTQYNLYGEHNKPVVTYTGNGSTASRTIETNGIGSVCLVTSTNGCCTMMPGGGFALNDNEVSPIVIEKGKFQAGVLTLTTTDLKLNSNGVVYTCHVL